MMDAQQEVKLSKFLSLVLRHRPEAACLTLDESGWVAVDDLLAGLREAGVNATLEDLKQVVANNSKQRFAFSTCGTKIRANQGHSVGVELGYEPKQPPSILYHGTATKYVDSIRETGLTKRARIHVHLSSTQETASAVGQRHGKLVLLTVKAEEMHKDGFIFFESDNGVWLTEHVPVAYIIFP